MGRYRRYGRQRSAGYERASEHIEAAHRFSNEMGGLDKGVKDYFFSLSPSQMGAILDEYGDLFGAAARAYAQETIPKWRQGSVQMSGQTAERLFRLLPKRMPHAMKLALIEALWQQHSPKSTCLVTFGPTHAAADVRKSLASHLEQVVRSYTLPDQLRARFDWLADGDAAKCQELLNHFLHHDVQAACDAVQGLVTAVHQVPNQPGAEVQHLRREVVIGGHKVDVVLAPSASDVTVEAGRTFAQTGGGPGQPTSGLNVGCVVVVVVVIILVVLAR